MYMDPERAGITYPFSDSSEVVSKGSYHDIISVLIVEAMYANW